MEKLNQYQEMYQNHFDTRTWYFNLDFMAFLKAWPKIWRCLCAEQMAMSWHSGQWFLDMLKTFKENVKDEAAQMLERLTSCSRGRPLVDVLGDTDFERDPMPVIVGLHYAGKEDDVQQALSVLGKYFRKWASDCPTAFLKLCNLVPADEWLNLSWQEMAAIKSRSVTEYTMALKYKAVGERLGCSEEFE